MNRHSRLKLRLKSHNKKDNADTTQTPHQPQHQPQHNWNVGCDMLIKKEKITTSPTKIRENQKVEKNLEIKVVSLYEKNSILFFLSIHINSK